MSAADINQFILELLLIINSSSPAFRENFLRGMVFRVRRVDSDGRGSISYFPVPIIKIKNDYEGGTITHEIWHQIDYHSGRALSSAFETYVGSLTTIDSVIPFKTSYDTGLYDPPLYNNEGTIPNRREDFAESAEEYFGYGSIGILPGNPRLTFFGELLATGNIPQP